MTPMKSQSSSYHKGKEVISYPPATRGVDEETVYFELDHFDEEETERDPNSECAPLIDPWHDVHPHFPKILGDYVQPPLPGRVWLSFYQQNMDISWAPLAFLIPNIIIRQGTSLLVPVHFEFGSGTALGWREWVDSELSDTSFLR